MDRFIDWLSSKINDKVYKIVLVSVIVFMFADFIYSASAENWVLTKVCIEKDLDVKDKEILQKQYDKVYNNETAKAFVDRFWTVDKVLMSYPNLSKQLQDGNRVYIKRLYPEIHPYFIRIKPEREGTVYDP